ncbi:aminodeoxychorismate/anthranilate synthase component II [Corynebacterium pseudokroppenstedtii]|uniref:Aminodeoxychorismate/anthranilate synthase component II n=1 Tax=Corynebacterium pseudokroppenstedtii TaxID=2804917 RepID=A0AAU0PZJ9_9CORY|nr:aminodeoxychorismate/anthranilate synthase component II [Corynebacterium pseudokroppenstedtii]MDU6478751.1 aminodeoxychorismate/anthranilate synthase component II [Corynebacterium kroppenstedtii]MBY0791308.1 aminodeoxychorismate/anthranilate synthase component II [Corynebacterium pseudokroppenstedtii]MCF6793555.1 aminodeoxychorismate/anthranilate synthase component II [Corynebacterium pseudokroppenstedtii]MCF8702819.1 aminodeoxychorismate/anthranilate synthase component II [Corynebacterium p
MRILVVDNYDSFVYNLVQYIGQLGETCTVWRNDDDRLVDSTEDQAAGRSVVQRFDGVLISPGPGTPSAAGQSIPLIKACIRHEVPMLGVCLGHQALAEALGGSVVRADELLHGKTSPVWHDGSGVMRGLPDPVTVTRYHSLTVDEASLPDELVVTGRSDSGMVMSMRHVSLPLHGVQFHPESIMTSCGHRIVANWMGCAGFPVDEERVRELENRHNAVLSGL